MYWEAVYPDRTIREGEGTQYADIPRDNLVVFRVKNGAATIAEMWTPPGLTGRNLRYRIRTDVVSKERRVIIGWIPGPAMSIDVESGQATPSDWATIGAPVPMGGER